MLWCWWNWRWLSIFLLQSFTNNLIGLVGERWWWWWWLPGEWVWQGRLEAGRYLALAHTSGHLHLRRHHCITTMITCTHCITTIIIVTLSTRCSTAKTKIKPPTGAPVGREKSKNPPVQTVSRSAAGHLWSGRLGQQWIAFEVNIFQSCTGTLFGKVPQKQKHLGAWVCDNCSIESDGVVGI